MARPGALSNTLFSGAATDDVLLVDPKDIASNSPITEYVSKAQSGLGKATDILNRSPRFIAPNSPITAYVSKVQSGLGKASEFFNHNSQFVADTLSVVDGFKDKDLSVADKLSRLDGVFGRFGTSVAAMSAPIRDAMVNALPAGTMDMATKVYVRLGEAYETYESIKDIEDVRGVLDALQRYTGDYGLTDLIDISAELAFLEAVNDTLVDLGSPGIMDIIEDKLNKDKTGSLRHDYYMTSWPTYVEYGRINQLERILVSVAPDEILGHHPGSIQSLLSRYSLPPNTLPSDYPVQKDRLLGVLNQLDKNWGRYNRNGSLIWDLSVFHRVSSDAVRVLEYDAIYRVPVTIGSAYQERDINETIRSQYRDYHFTRTENDAGVW